MMAEKDEIETQIIKSARGSSRWAPNRSRERERKRLRERKREGEREGEREKEREREREVQKSQWQRKRRSFPALRQYSKFVQSSSREVEKAKLYERVREREREREIEGERARERSKEKERKREREGESMTWPHAVVVEEHNVAAGTKTLNKINNCGVCKTLTRSRFRGNPNSYKAAKAANDTATNFLSILSTVHTLHQDFYKIDWEQTFNDMHCYL
jgi:hypothetical protein